MAQESSATASLYQLLLVFLMVLLGVCVHAFGSDPVQEPKDKELVRDSTGSMQSMPTFDDEFDLGACQQECRSKFGVDPYWGQGGGSSMWRLYAICIQDCNSKFWKEYDRRIQKLKDSNLE